MPNESKARPKRALVLGCGGVAGAAWEIAMLAELERALAWDAREADVIVGTSSGAVVAALLAAGVPVARMVASQRGELADDCWNHDVDTGGPQPPRPELRLTAPGLVWRALRGAVHPFTALSGLAPRGTAEMGAFRRLVDRFVPAGAWAPHPRTWIMVVDVRTGERVALGQPGAPSVPLREAVCASHAIPGWCPPVTWAGTTYVDGGIASPTSADLVVDSGVSEVLILAPMAARETIPSRRRGSRVARAMRRHMTSIVNAEVRALERAGLRVARLEPCAEDLAAIGSNMMNPRRRQRVFEAAVRSAKELVADALLAFEAHDPPREAMTASAFTPA